MSKVYKCDACGGIIENPYEERMKEFYVGVTCDMAGAFLENYTMKRKVHLCEGCYKGLYLIAGKGDIQ